MKRKWNRNFVTFFVVCLVSVIFLQTFASVGAEPNAELLEIPVDNVVSITRLRELYDQIKFGFENAGSDHQTVISAINSLEEICQVYRVPHPVKEFCVKVYYLYKEKESLPRKELKSFPVEKMAKELFGEKAKETILNQYTYESVLNEFSTFLSQNSIVQYKKAVSDVTNGMEGTSFQAILAARIKYFNACSVEDRVQWIVEKQKRLTEIELDMQHRECHYYTLSNGSACDWCERTQDAEICLQCHSEDPNYTTCYELSRERVDVLAEVYSLRYSLNLAVSCLTDAGALHNCLLNKRMIATPSEWTQTPAPSPNPLATRTPTHTTNIIYPDLNDGSGIQPTGTPIPWTYITPYPDA